MALTLEQMRHLAKLARLELDDAQLEALMAPINALMAHFEKLQALPLDEVEPTSHSIPVYNAFREDIVGTPLPREEALANAPEARDGLFIVPRIVEE
ncbi:MAG: Asp-tRNA(Asn)/Glu-tRNA(Gln) amidotransferase subunit GatC [Fimbriimonadales bacterium]|jgi:aspartyl-tRNA(Asn)/glutamyl-tRNA(Gln) amidotransferase subunit C|nr:Asp-tRNA(Asn)/Glu-tRNA(Gln) amidotransferase subunit GatC [Fimbriimonadales bacterium]GBC91482.1 Glutamyl-tRNA(Gln) amidotransferase subunit C [bacterium HR14]GIV13416.1 MAG: aspartyl/glutamyl-tRNA(Asn/Gln) amidotransferase subunit C [Fimbriimonadales bacterium]CUU11190.1 aspartyl/glutamyl-tRNA(Asn/Gln) amidotransferase subunit C [Armatimonadetes bacterium GBS]CUU36026.1 aspartyl/glutamyl-tRNA(Asn/Gln) amidotransferase subunit C [Armatimonadetes bacterium GXS]